MKSIRSPPPAEKGEQVLAANLLAQGGDDLAKTLQKLSATLGREVKLEGNPAEKQRTLALALRDFRVIQTKSAALPCHEGQGYAAASSSHHHHRSRRRRGRVLSGLFGPVVFLILFVVCIWGLLAWLAALKAKNVEPPPVQKFDPNPARFKS